MPPSRQYWPVEFRERLLVVDYLSRPVGLASQGGWRYPCSCFGSIPSVTKSFNFVCKGIVFPTDGAKLMVLFLPILDWSFLESLGQSVGSDHRTTYNLH